MISNQSKHHCTVLLIESEPTVAQSLSVLLTATGYTVVRAALAHEAIEKAKSSVDLILLDLSLWDMEGLELCHYLRQSEDTRNVPIIALSAQAGLEREKFQCLELGADDFINKPLQCADLLERIHSLLEIRHFHHQENQNDENVNEVKKILDHELVNPYFQPIYLLNPLSLLGVEVLSRPFTETPLKNPELLFEKAQECGLYFDLEMMVWRKAIEQFKKIDCQQRLFLNCSPQMVEDDHFMDVQQLFNRLVMDASAVYFELTERSSVTHRDIFYRRLHHYRDLGFKIAVDDVGGGFSSLETIVETRPEVVKIDRHIVHELAADSYKKSMVKFIVSFCREHDIICVAEGVETREELQILKDLNVNACQGYYFCQPKPQLDVPAFQSIIL